MSTPEFPCKSSERSEPRTMLFRSRIISSLHRIRQGICNIVREKYFSEDLQKSRRAEENMFWVQYCDRTPKLQVDRNILHCTAVFIPNFVFISVSSKVWTVQVNLNLSKLHSRRWLLPYNTEKEKVVKLTTALVLN